MKTQILKWGSFAGAIVFAFFVGKYSEASSNLQARPANQPKVAAATAGVIKVEQLAPTVAEKKAPETKYYQPEYGEGLWHVAKKTIGNPYMYPVIAKVNGIEFPYDISEEETLIIPDIASMDPTEVENILREAIILESQEALAALELDTVEYTVTATPNVPLNPPSSAPREQDEFFSPTVTARLP